MPENGGTLGSKFEDTEPTRKADFEFPDGNGGNGGKTGEAHKVFGGGAGDWSEGEGRCSEERLRKCFDPYVSLHHINRAMVEYSTIIMTGESRVTDLESSL